MKRFSLLLVLVSIISICFMLGGCSEKPTESKGFVEMIVFQSYRDGNWEAYAMNTNGRRQTNLTNNYLDDIYPCLSPDGGKIAFSRNGEVYVMYANGSRQTNLINSPGDDWCPCWSPDGGKIAFQSYRDGNWEIYVMNADGSGQTNLTNSPGQDVCPSWGR
jgi:Tol biopolymer transport system component